jgi:glutamate synthase (ferredoxin)
MEGIFDIPHDFFKKVCDFTIPKRASMQGMVLPKKENQADFARRL